MNLGGRSFESSGWIVIAGRVPFGMLADKRRHGCLREIRLEDGAYE